MLYLIIASLWFNAITLLLILGFAFRLNRMEEQNMATILFLRTKLGPITEEDQIYG